MTYTIDEFSADCRSALAADPGPAGLEQVRQHVERALTDEAFIATHLGTNADSPREILYEDPDSGFCIIAHVYAGGANPPPHDHGPTWAVYGQVGDVHTPRREQETRLIRIEGKDLAKIKRDRFELVS